jgi:hypothetical protein
MDTWVFFARRHLQVLWVEAEGIEASVVDDVVVRKRADVHLVSEAVDE